MSLSYSCYSRAISCANNYHGKVATTIMTIITLLQFFPPCLTTIIPIVHHSFSHHLNCDQIHSEELIICNNKQQSSLKKKKKKIDITISFFNCLFYIYTFCKNSLDFLSLIFFYKFLKCLKFVVLFKR